MTSSPSILVVGPLPPPVNGFSLVTQRFAERLRASGASVSVVPTVPMLPVGSSALRRRVARIGVILRAYAAVVWKLRPGAQIGSIYLPVSGGLGKLIESPFVLFARAKGIRLFVHHHSFAYLNSHSALAQCFLWLCGRHATHIALGARMATLLRQRYSTPNVVQLSNATFVAEAAAAAVSVAAGGVLRAGFLGNISAAKGGLAFVDVCEQMTALGVPFQARLAGPFENREMERDVLGRIRELAHVEWLGPVHDDSKDAFFRSIDVLIFPSNYANEAEPVTIIEALSYGVPVIATRRGGIEDLLQDDQAFCLADHFENFVSFAVPKLTALAQNPALLDKKKMEAKQRFDELRTRSLQIFEALFADMAGAPG